jgi:hypothetical protein
VAFFIERERDKNQYNSDRCRKYISDRINSKAHSIAADVTVAPAAVTVVRACGNGGKTALPSSINKLVDFLDWVP